MAGDDNTVRDELVALLDEAGVATDDLGYVDPYEAMGVWLEHIDLLARLAVSAADDTTTVRVNRDDLRWVLNHRGDPYRGGAWDRLRAALDPANNNDTTTESARLNDE